MVLARGLVSQRAMQVASRKVMVAVAKGGGLAQKMGSCRGSSWLNKEIIRQWGGVAACLSTWRPGAQWSHAGARRGALDQPV